MRPLALLPLALLLASCTSPPEEAGVAELRVDVLAEVPHDPTAFTQGLELADGVLYEGTGLVGRSELRATDPATGEVTARTALPGDMFGEGITVVGDRIWQLTWQHGVAIERDRDSFAELRRVTYPGEGWGLCHDGARLVMSDGSATLTFRDPATFEPVGDVEVTEDGEPLVRLNELECVDGAVYANVWQTDRIVRIDPDSGAVVAAADLSGLLTAEERAATDVLNGIAHVPGTEQEFLVTGKLWPTIFRVRLAEARG